MDKTTRAGTSETAPSSHIQHDTYSIVHVCKLALLIDSALWSPCVIGAHDAIPDPELSGTLVWSHSTHHHPPTKPLAYHKQRSAIKISCSSQQHHSKRLCQRF